LTHRFDVVGHFGTRLSYATVASQVARALREVDRLGSVFNLDPEWHADFVDLSISGGAGSCVFVVVAPHHYLDAYPKAYGKERSVIFASPNTEELSAEHAETLSQFGMVLCPSEFCAQTVEKHLSPQSTTKVRWEPLGFDEALAVGRVDSIQRRALRALRQQHRASRVNVLHFSTDQYWPGRKGTEELLRAWSKCEMNAVLRVHVPLAVYPDVMRLASDLGLDDDSFEVVTAPARGASSESLRAQFDWADAMVAPSRAEGFGIMLLSALAAGVPLLASFWGGQASFLSRLCGWHGLEEGPSAPLPGETGTAPTVDPDLLADRLYDFLFPPARQKLLLRMEDDDYWASLAWPLAARRYARILTEEVGGS
jgi:glycosyltransferase involved in cell wall biosynthesis